MALTQEMQQELNEERKIKELETVIVKQIAAAIEAGAGKGVGIGRNITVEFDISCIPEELMDLFHKRVPIMWGDISDDAPIGQRRSYYLHSKMVVEGDQVIARINKNW